MLIFEHRSAVYMRVNEQRSAENQRIMAGLGDFEQALILDNSHWHYALTSLMYYIQHYIVQKICMENS